MEPTTYASLPALKIAEVDTLSATPPLSFKTEASTSDESHAPSRVSFERRGAAYSFSDGSQGASSINGAPLKSPQSIRPVLLSLQQRLDEQGAWVGFDEGAAVVGCDDGAGVGATDGCGVGAGVSVVGPSVGSGVGDGVGFDEGFEEGVGVGTAVGTRQLNCGHVSASSVTR